MLLLIGHALHIASHVENSLDSLDMATSINHARYEKPVRQKMERTQGMPAGCPGDCAFPLVACPAPAGGDPCSDHGWCASAFGVCQCWFGYTGDDCSQCAEGYIRSA